MRVLFISQELPYSSVQHGGGRVSLSFLEWFSRNYEAHLLSYYWEDEKKFVSETQNLIKKVQVIDKSSKSRRWMRPAKKVFSFIMYPHVIIGYYENWRQFRKAVREEQRCFQPDIVVLNYTSTYILLPILKSLRSDVVLIGIAHDIVFQGLERLRDCEKNSLRKLYLCFYCKIFQLFEVYLSRSLDLVLTLSPKDEALLVRAGVSCERIKVIPPQIKLPDLPCKSTRIPESLLFVGAMHRAENSEAIELFLKQSFFRMRKENPNLQIFIVGATPPESLLTLSGQQGITVTGSVDDLSAYYEQTEVVICPLIRGAGVKIKVLEAMSYGLPVVMTEVAAEGIPVRNMVDCIMAPTGWKFEAAIEMLLRNAHLRNQIGSAARKLISERYTSDSAMEDLMEAITNCR